MTDLRAILGDKYDATLERATSAGPAYLKLVHDSTRRTIAEAALAAVLPDLLDEANTRPEDAEAKARRFANLLGNNAKALNDVLPRELLRQKAEAWDEGWNAAADAAEQCTVTDGYGPCGECATCDPLNPYRPTTTEGA